MKKILKEHSIYMVVLTILTSVLSVIGTLSFVYTDSLNYQESVIMKTLNIEKLLEGIYSSTWWAFILLLLFFIAAGNILCMIYKDMKFMGASLACWIEMMILAINLKNSLIDNLLLLLLYVPIIIIYIIVYKKEKEKITKKTKSKK
jgi:hypothetical protein